MACCNRGYEFAKEVMNEPIYQESIDPSAKCYAKARTLVTEIQTRCLMAFFTSCKTKLESLLSSEYSLINENEIFLLIRTSNYVLTGRNEFRLQRN